MKNTINSEEEMYTFLQNIPEIHFGGCAISALAIKRWLKKNKNIEAEIIFRCRDTDQLNRNKNAINGINTPTSCFHAFVKVGEKVFDCEGSEQESEYTIIMPEHLVVESCNQPKWNNSFDRVYVPVIERALQVDLSDIEIDLF